MRLQFFNIMNHTLTLFKNPTFRIFLLSVLTILVFKNPAFSQSQTTASGGTASGTGGTVTFTIGLPLYTNQTSSGVIINQGNQQPREFLSVSYRNYSINIGLKIFPSPFYSYFYIQTENENLSNLSFKLTSLDGKLVTCENINETLTKVNTEDYAEGIYFLQLYHSNELISSTRIVKINF